MIRNTKKNRKNTAERFDVTRDIVKAKIIAMLNEGIIPWKKPWFGMSRCYNYLNGYCYNIINDMLLEEPGAYITWKAMKKLGGEMKEGCDYGKLKKQIVKCWTKHVTVKDKDGNPVLDKDGNEKTRPIRGLKYENVINVKYTTLPPKKRNKRLCPARMRTADIIIENYLSTSGVTLHEEIGDRAFYSPTLDSATVPTIEQFKTSAARYSTIFHELGHSTGHESRLNRFDSAASFGNDPYAREELVAEFTAAILCNYTGVGQDESDRNSAAYIQNWSKAISNDPNMFVSACYAADKAARMIIGGKLEKVAESTELEAA